MNIQMTIVLEVTEIVKKTRAKLFNELKVGYRIRIEVPLKGPGRGRGVYATYAFIESLKTGESTYKSMNELEPILNCFEFKEVK